MDEKELEKLSKKYWREKKREELIAKAQELDEKYSKKRKTPTKKEKNDQEYQAMLNYKEPEPKPVVEEKSYDEDGWDVKIGDPIEYFDPELSYELTGYRPITANRGLDFDPKLFTVAADTYRRTGRYTQLIPGTFAHREHWIEEFNRCKDGITIGRYTLTGENYFFINYFRLPSVLAENKQESQEEDFPRFFAKQYEYFHYKALARKLGKDVNVFKSRGVGFSQMSASDVCCGYSFHRASHNMVTAFNVDYVTNTLDKVWQELDFLNTCTEGAFKRVRMKADTQFYKRASKVDKDKNETGWMSVIEGRVHDKPRKLRGARVYNLIFEECGSDPMLLDTYIQSRPLVDILGYRVGQRSTGGTGGDSGPALSGLKSIFYNPEAYQVLPYRHFYSRDGQEAFTGFFIPAYTLWFGKFDDRGVVDEEAAKRYYEQQWSTIEDPEALLKDKAEYCFTPEDAFILEGSNIFNTEKLAEQKTYIEQGMVEKPKGIKLIWPYSKELGGVDRSAVPKMELSNNGPIYMIEPPIKLEDGSVPINLYVIGADCFDSGKETSTGQTDLSKYGLIVFRRQYGLKPPKIVAIYKERPDDPSMAHDTALKLAEFYNAKVLFEATRMSIFTHFRRYGQTGYFLKRPRATLTSKTQNANQYGCPATAGIIEHQIELIQQYVYDYCDQIDFLEVIDELIRYTPENKGKFDLTAAFAMALLADEDMLGKRPKQEVTQKILRTIGYYKNEYGQKVFGVISTQEQNVRKNGWT